MTHVNINGNTAIITQKAKFLITMLVPEEVLLIYVGLTSKKVNFSLDTIRCFTITITYCASVANSLR